MILALLLAAQLQADVVRQTDMSVPAENPPSTVSIIAGGGVSLSDESAAIPVASVGVDAPLNVGPTGRLRIGLGLSGLPGETVSLAKVKTWKAAGLDVAARWQVGISRDGVGRTFVVAEYGFATRILPRDEKPRQRYPRYYGLGVAAEHRDSELRVDREISVTYGRADAASPSRGWGQFNFKGRVRIGEVRRVPVSIVGSAHLNAGHNSDPMARDLMMLAVGLGR